MLHKQHNIILIFCQRFALSFFREENPRHKKEKKMAESLLLCKTDSSVAVVLVFLYKRKILRLKPQYDDICSVILSEVKNLCWVKTQPTVYTLPKIRSLGFCFSILLLMILAKYCINRFFGRCPQNDVDCVVILSKAKYLLI